MFSLHTYPRFITFILGIAATTLPWSWLIARYDLHDAERELFTLLGGAHAALVLFILSYFEVSYWYSPLVPWPSDLHGESDRPLVDRLELEQTFEPPRSVYRRWADSRWGQTITVGLMLLPLAMYGLVAWLEWPRAHAEWFPVVLIAIAAAYLFWYWRRNWSESRRLVRLIDRLDAGDRTLTPADLAGYRTENADIAGSLVSLAYLNSGDADRLPGLVDFARGEGTERELYLAPFEVLALHETDQPDAARQRLQEYRDRFLTHPVFRSNEPALARKLGLPGHEELEATYRREIREQAAAAGTTEATEESLLVRDREIADPSYQTMWRRFAEEFRNWLGG